MNRRIGQKYLRALQVPEMTFDEKVNTLYAEIDDIKNGRTKLSMGEQVERIGEIQKGLVRLTGVKLEGTEAAYTTK